MHPVIIIPILLLLGWISLEVYLGYRIGLWRTDLTTDFVMWALVSGFVSFFNFNRGSTQRHFLRRSVIQTLGVAEVIQFATNIFVFNFWTELIFVPTLSLIAILAMVAEKDARHESVRTLLNGVLTLIGFALLAFFVQQLIAGWNGMDWPSIGRKFALPVWLTIALTPFIYTVSICAGHEGTFKRMNWNSRPQKASIHTKLALVTGLHFRAREIGSFNSPWTDKLASESTFSGSRLIVKEFRESFANSEQAAIEKKEQLRRYAGSDETDSDGRRLDRREFKETMSALDWLATCQMGWYRNDDQNEQYRADLLEILGTSFIGRGLPDDPDITLRISNDGQAWYAWRRTMTGWCFAIGAAGPPSDQWKYDGPEPPHGFPEPHGQWAHWTRSDDIAPNWDT